MACHTFPRLIATSFPPPSDTTSIPSAKNKSCLPPMNLFLTEGRTRRGRALQSLDSLRHAQGEKPSKFENGEMGAAGGFAVSVNQVAGEHHSRLQVAGERRRGGGRATAGWMRNAGPFDFGHRVCVSRVAVMRAIFSQPFDRIKEAEVGRRMTRDDRAPEVETSAVMVHF